jgi:microfibrillar-associated protein 1
VNDTPPDIDDTDGLNEEEEYEAWKLRELRRIKRDKEEQEVYEREEMEKERRRNMTDAEIIEENKKLRPEKDKSSLRFMQKYYHKGAFFNDDSENLLNRDYNQPTLEDKFDKSILPSVMQVKNFGKQGQTKWTHLSKEDTSQVGFLYSLFTRTN